MLLLEADGRMGESNSRVLWLYMYSLARVSAKAHLKETEAQRGEVSYSELASENLEAELEINPGFPVLEQLLPSRGSCSRDSEGVDQEFQNSLWETHHRELAFCKR